MSADHLSRSALFLGASVLLAACSTTAIDTGPSASEEQIYSALYPYYAEICAVSELKKKPGFGAEISSGVGGHAVLYLNGVCRDDSTQYPSIKLCGAETPPEQRGVGVSVNAHYKNANWVATPGRDFFFHGTLKPGQRLTRAIYEETQARAESLGILDQVEFHQSVFAGMPPGMSQRDFKYEMSVATDYAIGFGRDRYCARVPLNRERMSRVVDFLNGLNAVYKEGNKEFEWDVLRNNCSHVTHNALASAGIWDFWETGRSIFISALDFPVPKNEFVNQMRRTNDMRIDDLDTVYAAAAHEPLMQTDSLPAVPGAVAEAEPVVQDNDIYDADLSLIFYDDPFFGSYDKYFHQIFSEPRYFDLRANLQHFADLYRKIGSEREPLQLFLDRHGGSTLAERHELERFYVWYYSHIGRERAAVNAALAFLPPSMARKQVMMRRRTDGKAVGHPGSQAASSTHQVEPADGFPNTSLADRMPEVQRP